MLTSTMDSVRLENITTPKYRHIMKGLPDIKNITNCVFAFLVWKE